MKTIIFDIDGTLALIEHRRKFLQTSPKDWGSFNLPQNMEQDLPNKPIIELLRLCARDFDNQVIFVTGRHESSREVTYRWLEKHCEIHLGMDNGKYTLFMRKDGDYRADNIVKKEILNMLLATGHDILFAVDDRKQVVDMWRKNGITCLQVAEGDF